MVDNVRTLKTHHLLLWLPLVGPSNHSVIEKDGGDFEVSDVF